MKCEICRQDYSPACDWRQGRCPNHMPLIGSAPGLVLGYIVVAILLAVMMVAFAKILRVIDVLY